MNNTLGKRHTLEQRKQILDKFFKLVDEGQTKRQAAKQVGVTCDTTRKWTYLLYPEKAVSLYGTSSNQPDYKKPTMISVDFPSTPYTHDDPKKRMALTLLDNCENILKTVRELLG